MNLWLVMMCIGFLLIGFGMGNFYCSIVRGEDFNYNMTKQMQDEGRLLEFCIHNTTIKIPDLDKFCGLHYGGIDTVYGDKIK